MKWHGAAVEKKVRQATAKGINKTMSACVVFAKRNHSAGAAKKSGKGFLNDDLEWVPTYSKGTDTSRGWHNITSAAEGSISIYKFASVMRLFGIWGSRGIDYFKKLEFRHGHILYKSAEVNYRDLPRLIKESFA